MRAGLNQRRRTNAEKPRRTVLHTRPPLSRMMRLHELLAEKRYPNCQRLAEELEVSPKTVQRDIDYMRDQLTLPIDYSAAERGFFYTQEVVNFPAAQISQGELMALFVARRALEQHRGTPYEKPLGAAFDKLTAQLPEQIKVSWARLGEPVSFRAGMQGRGVVDLRVFSAVSDAILRSQELEFDYRKAAARKDAPPERRRVQPLQMRCEENQWYLDVQDLVRRGTRTFVLGRMSRVRNTGKGFTRPSNFSPEAMLAGSFGVFSGLKVERLRLEFDAAVADFVRERTWHPSQRLAELPEGRVELTLEVGISPAVERWLLGWGDQVDVREPVALRQTLTKVAGRAARRHGVKDEG